MMELRNAIEDVLTHDPVLLSYLGYDDGDAMPKIYETVAARDAQPNFLVWQIIPGQPPAGTYEDQRAIESKLVQMTVWSVSQDTAWSVWAVLQDALEQGDWTFLAPYRLMHLNRMGDEQLLPDNDTSWWQIATTYHFALSK